METTENKINFVVADDDKDDQLLLLQAFTDNQVNYAATSVYNGSQLMDYLLSRKAYKDNFHSVPDFIFLDLNMPLQNGFEVLKEIRANAILQNIPIYVLSTSCYPSDQENAMKMGATRFYTKPHQYQEIRRMVDEIVLLN